METAGEAETAVVKTAAVLKTRAVVAGTAAAAVVSTTLPVEISETPAVFAAVGTVVGESTAPLQSAAVVLLPVVDSSVVVAVGYCR